MSQNYNLSYLQEVSKGNIPFMLDMIQIFLTKTPETLEILHQEIEKSNWEMVGFFAHKLKATYAYMGMSDLKEILIKIEKSAKQNENLTEIPAWFQAIYNATQPALKDINEQKELLEKSL